MWQPKSDSCHTVVSFCHWFVDAFVKDAVFIYSVDQSSNIDNKS